MAAAGTPLEPPSPAETLHARTRFAEIAAREDAEIDVAEAALWIAAESCAGLDVPACRARIDDLGDEIGHRLELDSLRGERIQTVNDGLFRVYGFAGERVDYYDPRNSFLNHTLERRRGIPITLCVLYVTVARRIGLRAEGISFPGHFLAKIEPSEDGRGSEVLVDAYEGRIVTREECQQRLRAAFGGSAVLTANHLRAASNKEILFRMLSNLKVVFANTQHYEQALACSDRNLLLAPDHAQEHRDRGLVYQRLDCVRPAVTDLERYLDLAPDDAGAPAVRMLLDALRQKLPALH